MTIAILGESYWERFCQAIGMEEMRREQRFETNSERLKHRAALNEVLIPIFLGKSQEEWFHIFREADILCAPINTFANVLHDSALMQSVSLWKPKLAGKEIRAMGNPIEIDGEYLTLDLPPPLKGEHTIEVLHELGYSKTEIDEMLAQGIAFSPSTT